MSATKPRTGRKFQQVMDGARQVFVAMGYERASVDEIARAAGVSKATLYSYFPEKRQLFTEVYRSEILRIADAAMEVLAPSVPPEIALRRAAETLVNYATSEFGVAMYRICIAESPRFPEIGQAFYESGPELGRARLGTYLRGAVHQGALQIDDIDLAADQFFQLCQASVCDRVLCNVQTEFSPAELDRVIDGAVSMFLARHAVVGHRPVMPAAIRCPKSA